MRALASFLIFIIIFSLGASLRLLWFFTFQKKLVEDNYFYKSYREMKGGANTPQEAWQGYLQALEKGDIEGALMYVWEGSRGIYRETLNRLYKNNLLKQYAKNHSVYLKKSNKKYEDLEENEQAFLYEYITQKDIEIALYEDMKEQLEKEWLNKGANSEKLILRQIFKYNPYTKKWFIK